jgi:toxin ParE1/3/4
VTYYFHPAAAAEHYENILFYENRRPGLGSAYLQDIERIMEHVMQDPLRYPVERKPNIRRVSLGRFPFTVIFRDLANSVQLLAIAHKRRRPGYWINRL